MIYKDQIENKKQKKYATVIIYCFIIYEDLIDKNYGIIITN